MQPFQPVQTTEGIPISLGQNPARHLIQNIDPEPDLLRSDNRKLSVALIYDKSEWPRFSPIPENLKLIHTKLVILSRKIRAENFEQFQDFEKQLYTAIRKKSPQQPGRWLFRAFDDLVGRLSTTPSWRAVINIVNAIHLVYAVSSNYNRKHTPVEYLYLKSKMLELLENLLNETFSDFLRERGGWEDFLDYYEHVSKNDAENSSRSLWDTIIPAAVSIGLAMLVLGNFK